jgi:hypothetical protein
MDLSHGDVSSQHRHLLAFQHPGHKLQSFVHFGTLLPRHFGVSQKPESVTYVSGMMCNLCARKDKEYFGSPGHEIGNEQIEHLMDNETVRLPGASPGWTSPLQRRRSGAKRRTSGAAASNPLRAHQLIGFMRYS